MGKTRAEAMPGHGPIPGLAFAAATAPGNLWVALAECGIRALVARLAGTF